MDHADELRLTPAFKLAQRTFAQLLDRRALDAADAFAARQSMRALQRDDRTRLLRWLGWQCYARNASALTRIERVDSRLAAGVLHARAQLPVRGRPAPSEFGRRTA